MLLLEFAAQGVRGVAPPGGRATLRPGYNVISADGAVLRRLLEALLLPAAHDAEAIPRTAGGPAGATLRAGLTLVGNDRVTYRLVRDFAAGCQLHRFDAGTRSFALVSADVAGVRQFLHETAGVPSPARLSTLLSLSAAELPSRQGTARAPAAAARSALPPEQVRRRREQLEAELEKAKLAERLQMEVDQAQERVSAVEEALADGARLREGLERAAAARAELEPVAALRLSLGDGAEQKIAGFEKASARLEEARVKVAAEREAMDEVEARGVPSPFWQDRRFWPAAGGGVVVAAGGAVAAALRSELRLLALAAIPAFGWAAWIALEWVRALEGHERVARRRRIVDEWEKKIEGLFERDGAEVRGAMSATGASKAEDLLEALSRVADADQVVEEWRRRLAEWEASPEVRDALARKGVAEAELRALEARVADEVGGFVRDLRSIELDLERADAELQPAAAPEPVARAAPEADPLKGLVERAAEELGATPAAVARGVVARASQTLSGLSFQRLQALQVDARGLFQVTTGGRPVPAATMVLADRDLVYLAVKLALLEQALAGGKLVALAEDAFTALSDGSRRFAARLLKQIARPGQLVHATSDASFRGAADHAV